MQSSAYGAPIDEDGRLNTGSIRLSLLPSKEKTVSPLPHSPTTANSASSTKLCHPSPTGGWDPIVGRWPAPESPEGGLRYFASSIVRTKLPCGVSNRSRRALGDRELRVFYGLSRPRSTRVPTGGWDPSWTLGGLRFDGRMPYFASSIVRTKLPCGVSSR